MYFDFQVEVRVKKKKKNLVSIACELLQTPSTYSERQKTLNWPKDEKLYLLWEVRVSIRWSRS